jgi:hypothetical protein
MKKIFYIFLTILIVSLFSQNVYAQEQDKDSGKSQFMIAPYLWIVNINATNTVGNVSVPMDISFGDLFSVMKFAGQAHFEIKQNKWGAILDLTYMNIGEDHIALQLPPELPLPEASANYGFTVWMYDFIGT